MADRRTPLIKVVGMSGSGKSTLVGCLRKLGYDAQPVSQEHSEIPDLWQHFEKPYALIYLSVSIDAVRERRPKGNWTHADLLLERNRLNSAHEAADLRIDTSMLTPQQVCDLTVTYLNRMGVEPSEQPLPPIHKTGSSTKYTSE